MRGDPFFLNPSGVECRKKKKILRSSSGVISVQDRQPQQGIFLWDQIRSGYSHFSPQIQDQLHGLTLEDVRQSRTTVSFQENRGDV
jgi:hypothetical protein